MAQDQKHSPQQNRRVLLKAYPVGLPEEADFELVTAPVPEVKDGQFLVQNLYFSLDAGFRQWMKAGASDNYLEAMPLGKPVMSITIGRVIQSRRPGFPVGQILMGRFAWEEYTLSDGADYCVPLAETAGFPLHYYVGTIGPTGLTAYFGLTDIGQVKAGDIVLVSAAAGAVGVMAGQIAKALGCKTIGITSSDEKCRWLVDEVGYDAAINYNAPAGIEAEIRRVCPTGIDVYFDNVAGKILDAAMANLRMNARIILCGALAAYNEEKPVPGPYNMFEAITKRATLRGFMFSDYVASYPAAYARLQKWLEEGRIKSFDEISVGIETTASAFCGMFRGRNKGKVIVKLADKD